MPFKVAKFFLAASIFCVIIVSTSTLFPFIVGKYAWFRATVDLALIAFLCGLALQPGSVHEERLMRALKHPITLALGAFTLIMLVAGFFGVDPGSSFWSNFERGEGVIQLLHLFLFTVLLATLFHEERDWQLLFLLAMVATVGMILYGVGAGLKYTDAETVTRMVNGAPVPEYTGKGGIFFQSFRTFIGPGFGEPSFRFQGSIGNPAYVAAYMIFSLFYGVYLLLTRYRGRLRSFGGITTAALCAIFLVVFFSTATRGGLLGLGAGGLVALAYLAYRSRRLRPWLAGIAVGGIVVVIAMAQLRSHGFLKNVAAARIFDLSFSAETFRDRTVIWKTAIEGIKEHPILGWGAENFMYVFTKHMDPGYFSPSRGFGAWFDRAHDVFLDYTIAGGGLGLLSYLAIFAAWAWMFMRYSRARDDADRRGATVNAPSMIVMALLIVMPVAYLVQGLVLFDVLVIYVNLYLFLAFSVFLFPAQSGSSPASRLGEGGRWTLAGAGIAFAAFAMIYSVALPVMRSRAYIRANQGVPSVKTVNEFTALFDRVLDVPSPVGREEVVRFLGNDIMEIVSSQPPQPDQVAHMLVSYIEPKLFLRDARHLLLAAGMYTVMWRAYGHAEDYAAAEQYFRKGLAVGPHLPPMLYGLMDLYRMKGDHRGMEEIGNRILAIWPEDHRITTILQAVK